MMPFIRYSIWVRRDEARPALSCVKPPFSLSTPLTFPFPHYRLVERHRLPFPTSSFSHNQNPHTDIWATVEGVPNLRVELHTTSKRPRYLVQNAMFKRIRLRTCYLQTLTQDFSYVPPSLLTSTNSLTLHFNSRASIGTRKRLQCDQRDQFERAYTTSEEPPFHHQCPLN